MSDIDFEEASCIWRQNKKEQELLNMCVDLLKKMEKYVKLHLKLLKNSLEKNSSTLGVFV